MSIMKLGGFVENHDVIEGTKEDFIEFNWYLACEYYDAVIKEDFDSLGEFLNDALNWHSFMNGVCIWLNYDDKMGKDMEDELPKLYNGTIKTRNDRTFIEAAREHGWFNLVKGLTKELEKEEKKLKLTRRKG